MQFFLAPMEGITGYIYRNAYQTYFHQADGYLSPFLAPTQKQTFSTRERNDILPAHNVGISLTPQILANQADAFLRAAQELMQMGYREVNLNLGCPAATVVHKRKGAGLLAQPDQLEHLLDDIFAALPNGLEVSIKTRIGVEQPEEFLELIDLYNQYPLRWLMVHPRVQRDLYNNKPNWEAFGWAVRESRHPLCYNGDLFTVADYQAFCAAFPTVKAVMLGRGVIGNPNLLGELRGGPSLDKAVLRQFHDAILAGYQAAFSGDRPVLFKMKELWHFMLPLFQNGAQYEKKIRKAQRIAVYQAIVEQLFTEPLASEAAW